LQQAFVDFLHRMPFYGTAVLCTDDAAVRAIVDQVTCPVTSYGTNEDAQVRALDIRPVNGRMHFRVQRRNGITLPDLDIVLNLPGREQLLPLKLLLQQPLALGADIVVHSATKVIGGHADLLMGVVCTNAPTAERLRDHRYTYGATPGSLEAFLALRGLRTLSVRLERAQANALALAELLGDSDYVKYVLYPGLTWHPGHALAKRQMRGFGTMLSFEVAGGEQAAARLCEATTVFTNATSLGGVESLMEVRGNRESERAMGTPAALIRLSAGIEHVDDLLADLQQALTIAHSG
jgi:O-acetylhomoserine/O-acetylserine sulfhydrylase-like pyridoxal-dependent enzyme